MAKDSFQRRMGNILYGDDDEPDPPKPEDSDEETTPEGIDDSAPDDQEPPEDVETPDAESTEDEEAEEPEEVPEPDEPEESEETAEVEEDEEDEVEEPEEPERPELPEGFAYDDDGNIVVEVADGETVPAEELRKSFFREADYTQAKQRLSAEQQRWQAREQLLDDISEHPRMREFVSEHPEAVRYLVAHPDETRELMQSPQDFEDFKQDYETLQENPRLAKQYLESSEEGSAREQLQQERVKRQIVGFARELEQGVEQIASAERYEDVIDEDDVRAVKEHVMSMGGFGPGSSQPEIIEGVGRLANIFLTPDGERLDMQVVIDRFDAIAANRRAEQTEEVSKAEEHNRQVDEELEEQKDRTPKSPKGKDPAPTPRKPKKRESYREVMSALRGD